MTAPLPDAEQMAVTYLLSVSAVTDLVSTRIHTELPADSTFPLVKVSRPSPGAILAEATLDAASIQTDVYGDTKQSARDAAAAVVAAYQDAYGWTAASGAYISTCRPLGGLIWLPDESFAVPKPRYVFDTTIYVRNG